MKVIDTVNQTIKKYPELYLKNSFENSKFSVLHHYFIVLGNGIKWAYTEDIKQGGYLTDPLYKKEDDEYVRIYDPPYGSISCDLDKRYFSEDLYGIYKIDHNRSKLLQRNYIDCNSGYYCFAEDLKSFNYVEENSSPYDPNATAYIKALIERGNQREEPYPNFQKKYSCFWEIDVKLIQDDWRIEGINHLKYWLNYFNSDQIINLREYPNDRCVNQFKEYILKYCPQKSIEEIAKAYEYPEFNGDYKKLAEYRFDRTLKNNIEFLKETITLLEK